MKKLFAFCIVLALCRSASAQCHTSFTDSVSGLTVYFNNTSTPPPYDSFMRVSIKCTYGSGTAYDTFQDYYFTHHHSVHGIYPRTYPAVSKYGVTLVMTYSDTFFHVLCTDTARDSVTTIAGGLSRINLAVFRDTSADTSVPCYFPYDSVKIWAISYDSASHLISAVDSQVVASNGKYLFGYFDHVQPGNYVVKAASLHSDGFAPTYAHSALHWNLAKFFFAPSGSAVNIFQWYDLIYMQAGDTTTAGPGFIAGDVRYGAGKGTAVGDPVIGLTIYLNNNVSGKLIGSTITDNLGKYYFNVPFGTYTVYPEKEGLIPTPWTNIPITYSDASQPKIDFIVTSKTIKPASVSVTASSVPRTTPYIYPNPAIGSINIILNGFAKNNSEATVRISDLLGKVVYDKVLTITSAITNTDISSLQPGIYFVIVESGGKTYHQKIVIK